VPIAPERKTRSNDTNFAALAPAVERANAALAECGIEPDLRRA
jgi:hypothetical protein